MQICLIIYFLHIKFPLFYKPIMANSIYIIIILANLHILYTIHMIHIRSFINISENLFIFAKFPNFEIRISLAHLPHCYYSMILWYPHCQYRPIIPILQSCKKQYNRIATLFPQFNFFIIASRDKIFIINMFCRTWRAGVALSGLTGINLAGG